MPKTAEEAYWESNLDVINFIQDPYKKLKEIYGTNIP